MFLALRSRKWFLKTIYRIQVYGASVDVVFALQGCLSRFWCKMARSARGRHNLSSHMRSTPYPLPSYRQGSHQVNDVKNRKPKRLTKAIKKDWEDAVCSVCMEFPHNAVLLLCSSHDKGCRPYMCGTSYRYSNCLDQFKKAYMKAEKQNIDSHALSWLPSEKSEATELACPLCRGQVKGWTVVEPAREYLNTKKRSCMQDNCSFAGTYKELRKHVKAEHPSAKPRQVDPVLEQKWRRLEHEREREDVISTIRSSMPGAMVMGDYVIENNDGYDSDDATLDMEDDNGRRGRVDENWFNFLFLLQAVGNSGNANFASRFRRSQRVYQVLDGEHGAGGRVPQPSSMAPELSLLAQREEGEGFDEDGEDSGPMFIRQGSVAAEMSGRRRRRRRRGVSRSGIGLT